jgi:hypothetical protein
MSAQTWAEVICSHFRISPELHFDGKMLTNAISRQKHFTVSLDIPWTNIPNDHNGIFCRTQKINGKRVHYYYATESGKGPSLDKSWTEEIHDGDCFLKAKVTRSNRLKTSVDETSLTFETTIPKKRKLISPEKSIGGLLGGGSDSLEAFTYRPSSLPPQQWSFESYWTSTEAKKLFRVLDSETDALQAINNQMELLHMVLSDSKGYQNVAAEYDSDDDLTTHQKYAPRTIIENCLLEKRNQKNHLRSLLGNATRFVLRKIITTHNTQRNHIIKNLNLYTSQQ